MTSAVYAVDVFCPIDDGPELNWLMLSWVDVRDDQQ